MEVQTPVLNHKITVEDVESNNDGESTAVGPKPTSADKKNETPQNRSSEKENKFAIERERSTVKPQSSKIDKREEHREEIRTSSSKSKRSPSLKQEKESDSETENLQLPPISPPANETSSVENSRNNSSLMVASPEGESETIVFVCNVVVVIVFLRICFEIGVKNNIGREEK